ncbi:hypothetical protein RFI_16485, partial [Reticulomyxa filosa]
KKMEMTSDIMETKNDNKKESCLTERNKLGTPLPPGSVQKRRRLNSSLVKVTKWQNKAKAQAFTSVAQNCPPNDSMTVTAKNVPSFAMQTQHPNKDAMKRLLNHELFDNATFAAEGVTSNMHCARYTPSCDDTKAMYFVCLFVCACNICVTGSFIYLFFVVVLFIVIIIIIIVITTICYYFNMMETVNTMIALLQN